MISETNSIVHTLTQFPRRTKIVDFTTRFCAKLLSKRRPNVVAILERSVFSPSRYLHMAISGRYEKVALALIRAAPSSQLLDTANDDAMTPLHLSVMTGQWRVVRWLIVAGAKPCPRNIRGDTPLHLAASLGDIYCCKAIVDPVHQQERDGIALEYPIHPYQKCDLDQLNYSGESLFVMVLLRVLLGVEEKSKNCCSQMRKLLFDTLFVVFARFRGKIKVKF